MEEGVTVIPIYGILAKKPGTFDYILEMTSYEKIHEDIEEALSDKKIGTILLDIDSPGGEVNGLVYSTFRTLSTMQEEKRR